MITKNDLRNNAVWACGEWYDKFVLDFPYGVETTTSGWLSLVKAGYGPVLSWLFVKTGDDNFRPNLSGVDLRGIDLRWSDMRYANLTLTDLRGVDIRESDLRGVDLRGVDLRDVDLRDVDMRGSDLRESDLRRVNLCGVDLRSTKLIWVDLNGSDLRRVDLSGVDLSWANLGNVNLTGAKLHGTKLRMVNLRSTQLSEVDLSGVDLYGSVYDNKTIFPDGFSPIETEMIAGQHQRKTDIIHEKKRKEPNINYNIKLIKSLVRGRDRYEVSEVDNEHHLWIVEHDPVTDKLDCTYDIDQQCAHRKAVADKIASIEAMSNAPWCIWDITGDALAIAIVNRSGHTRPRGRCRYIRANKK